MIVGGRGAVNPEGLQFYNNLIDELMKEGIQINAVLYHIDLPQILEDEYSGWVSPKIITFNHDLSARRTGHLFVHHSLLAHASTVRLYRQNYQAAQKGTIGLNMYTMWLYLFTDSAEDIETTETIKTFLFVWILHPLVFGDYPETMRKIAGSRLPSFTNFESELVINSFDFIGLNHYTSIYVSNHPNALEGPLQDFTADLAALFRGTRDAPPSVTILPGEMVDPHGLELILEYICGNYGSLSFYIQENGQSVVLVTRALRLWRS